MTDKERLKMILNYYNLTTSRFAAKIGLTHETMLDNIVNGQTPKIGRLVRSKIDRYCNNEINTYWLYTGRGQMLIDNYSNLKGKDMTDSEKMCYILHRYKYNATDFAAKIGVNVQKIYDIQHGKSNISKKVRPKIIAAFPELREFLSPHIESLPIYNNEFGIQTIGKDNVVNVSDCKEEINLLKSQITILQKDVEIWQTKYQATKEIVSNQQTLIDYLTQKKNA